MAARRSPLCAGRVLGAQGSRSPDFGLDLRYDGTGDLLGHRNRFTIGFAPTYGVTQDNRFANVFGHRGARLNDNEQQSLNLDWYLQNSFYLTPSVALVAPPRPGRPRLAAPLRNTARPFTQTRSIPVASACGSAVVARSATVAGSKSTRSA